MDLFILFLLTAYGITDQILDLMQRRKIDVIEDRQRMYEMHDRECSQNPFQRRQYVSTCTCWLELKDD